MEPDSSPPGPRTCPEPLRRRCLRRQVGSPPDGQRDSPGYEIRALRHRPASAAGSPCPPVKSRIQGVRATRRQHPPDLTAGGRGGGEDGAQPAPAAHALSGAAG